MLVLCWLGAALPLLAGCTEHANTDVVGENVGCADEPLIFAEEAKILPSQGAVDDLFGVSVSVDADSVLVGAREGDGAEANSGSAYFFMRSAAGWVQTQQLTAEDGEAGDWFGRPVAHAGDTAIVGALGEDDGGDAAGAAYVFVRTATSWEGEAKLTADDAAAEDHFGNCVALSDNTAIVGAPLDDDAGGYTGAAYIFVRGAAGWIQQQKLTADDAHSLDDFGVAVAISGNTALVGAYLADAVATDSGAAYVFVRGTTGWTQQAKLVAADDGGVGDKLGNSVALEGDVAVVGAPFHGGGADSGAVYVFVRASDVWNAPVKLTASSPSPSDLFGLSVATHGNRVLIGARGDTGNGAESGAAYVFERSGGAWYETQRLTGNDTAAGDWFGYSVGVHGDTVAVGAASDADNGTDSGSAYVFSLKSEDGDACAGADECASGFCVDSVCCNSPCGGDNLNDCQVCSTQTGAPVSGTCSPAPTGTECRPAADVCDAPEECNGVALECPADEPAPDGTACDDGDPCTGGDSCQDGTCMPGATNTCLTPPGDPCTSREECQTNFCTDDVCCTSADCTPFRCDAESGNCPDGCSSTAECQPGYACSSDGRCVDASSSDDAADDGGCSCSTPGRRPFPPALPWMVLGLVAAARRRRELWYFGRLDRVARGRRSSVTGSGCQCSGAPWWRRAAQHGDVRVG